MLTKPSRCQSCVDCDLKSPLFNLLSHKELQYLNSDRYEVEFSAGDSIFKQGSAVNNILSLTSGKVKLYLEGIAQQSLIFKISRQWDLLGGPGLFIDNRHHCSARAIEDARICFINHTKFREILCQNKEFSNLFWKQMNQDIVHLSNRFLSNSQKHMHGRMADSLIYLSEVFHDSDNGILIGKKDIAELSGMTRDSAVRVLKRFSTDKILEVENNFVKIINYSKLEELSRVG